MLVEFKCLFLDIDHFNFFCECHFNSQKKIRGQVSAEFPKTMATKYHDSNYVLSWDLDEKYSNIHDTVEVSFDFYVEDINGEALVDVGQVKNCGIRVLNITPDYEKMRDDYFQELSIVEVIHKPLLILLHP